MRQSVHSWRDEAVSDDINAGGNMADQDDVRRIALSLPQTVEAEDRFAFSVVHNGKQKGILWVWHERVEPKKPRVPRPDVVAIRVANGAEKEALLASDRANYVATLLASCPPNARRDIYLISTQPGAPRESDPHMPGVVEHVVLSTGRALVGVAESPIELHPGDYIAYPGDVAHLFKALDPDTVAVLVSEHV